MRVAVEARALRRWAAGAAQATVADLQLAIYKRNKKYHPSRQRLTLPPPDPAAAGGGVKPTVLEPTKRLSDYFDDSAADACRVVLKDLGPQVGYRTVFVLEYLGPLLIYPLFFVYPQIFYPWQTGKIRRADVQEYALVYWSFHYAKRIAESMLVHRFSHATMPLPNLFRNCAYYWAFAALIGYIINHPLYTPPPFMQMKVGLTIAIVAQWSNLYCHVILRDLRPSSGGPAGKRGDYQIPRGFLFEYITCANYFTEIMGWLGFNIATQTLPGAVFLVAGAVQMGQWALIKHRRLTKVWLEASDIGPH
eukprot:SM000170S02685  [mRNA]  locus=s170:301227:302979:+ [translate_table: standard]